jgi:GT2 family glycosyltransferase
VIVITYHRGAFLAKALESIYAQEGLPGPFEVIVVDNGGDGVVGTCPRPDVSLRIIRPGRNLGVAGGRNLGMSLASSPYVVSLDDDAIWHDTHDLSRFLARLAADERCACVAGRIVDPHTGATDSRLLPAPNKDRLLRAVEPMETPYFYGGAHALRAASVRQVGGYPERLLYGMEEFDLSLRLVNAGYSIVYDPAIAALHYAASAGSEAVRSTRWTQNALNKSRVAWRLLPMPYPLTIGLIWSAAALIKTGRLRAVAEMWRTLWHERKLLRAERQVISPAAVRQLKRIGARLLY